MLCLVAIRPEASPKLERTARCATGPHRYYKIDEAVLFLEERMGNIFIYGLLDTRPERMGELRYVGQSSVGMIRPQVIHYAKCRAWQLALRKIGLREEIIIIEEWAGAGDWKQWLNETEIFYIAYFRMIGADLTNLTLGGEGGRTSLWTQEQRDKMSRLFKGRKNGPPTIEALENLSKAMKGKKKTAAHKAKIQASNVGKNKGKPAWNKGKQWSPEVRENIRKGRWGDRRENQ